jgi:Methylpurine-DNA glycosylase (MPG)
MQPHQRPQPDEAMGTDLRQDGLDLCAAGTLWLTATAQNTGAIGKSVRIGLTRNADRPRRFYERGNPHVSIQRGYPSSLASNYIRVLTCRIPGPGLAPG